MHEYFDHVVESLNIDDISVLGILADNDATAKFKAMRKKDVFSRSGLTEAKYRKVLHRLDALNFIEVVIGGKEHKFYINDFGLFAIEKSLEDVS